MLQVPSQILRADTLKRIEDTTFRCVSIFSNNIASSENETSFLPLESMQEVTVAPQNSQTISIEEKVACIILPLVGSIHCRINGQENVHLFTEQVMHITGYGKANGQITNTSEESLISYLQIGIRSENISKNTIEIGAFSSNVKNVFLPIFETSNAKGSIGFFEGRREEIYSLKDKKNGVLAFVINGAFEFQNRLLENKDAIKIWDLMEIELEALSENAIIIIVELFAS